MSAPQPPPSAPPAGSDSGDLFDYTAVRRSAGFVLRAPLRHPLVAAGILLAVLGLAVAALKVLPKRYVVWGSVLAQRSPMMGSISNPGLNREGDAPTRAAREVVLRRDNLISLCRQTDFARIHMANRAPAVRFRDYVMGKLSGHERTEEELLEDLVDGLEDKLSVMVSMEGTVTISFEWSSPDLAYRMVGAALQSFLEARHASEVSIVSEAVAILETHASRLQKDIGDMVVQLEEKERRLGRGGSAPRRSAPAARPRVARDEDLMRVEATLAARRRALADLEDFRQRRLAELQAQLAQQLTLYAPQHPVVASTRQNIETLAAPSPQIESLRAEIGELERESARRGGMGGTEPDGGAAFRAEIIPLPLRSLEDDPRVEYERGQLRLLFRQYSSVLDRLDGARVELETARAAFKHRYSVITPPQMPKRPSRPNALLVMVGALFGGIAVAFVGAALVDLRSGRIVEPWQVEKRLGVRVIAHIPE